MPRQLKTLGISPKAILAFLYPFIATVMSTLGSFIITGDFNDAELRVGLAGLGASGVAALGAYVGRPGRVAVDSSPRHS